jgi:hypothetical protein
VIVYLVGMPGAGKSVVGEELAGRLGVPFIDLDAEIERATGSSVADIFAAEGEAAFRAREAAALTDAAVLLSFMLVNLSLPWLARRGRTGPRGPRRVLDVAVPSLALLLCGWLLVHTGWPSLVAATALAVVGLVVGRRLRDRSGHASPEPQGPGAR